MQAFFGDVAVHGCEDVALPRWPVVVHDQQAATFPEPLVLDDRHGVVTIEGFIPKSGQDEL